MNGPHRGDPLPFLAGVAIAASIWGTLALGFGTVVATIIICVLVLALWLHVLGEKMAKRHAERDRREAEERARKTW